MSIIDVEKVENLLKSDVSTYQISKETGITETTLHRYRSGEGETKNMRLETAEKLYEMALIEEQKILDKAALIESYESESTTLDESSYSEKIYESLFEEKGGIDTVDEMATLVLDDIKQKGGMTFVDMEYFFEKHNFSYQGDMWLSPKSFGKNVYIWTGWNEQASDVIAYLLENGCGYAHVPKFEYLIGGKVPTLKMAKNPLRDYKEERWYPVVCVYQP